LPVNFLTGSLVVEYLMYLESLALSLNPLFNELIKDEWVIGVSLSALIRLLNDTSCSGISGISSSST